MEERNKGKRGVPGRGEYKSPNRNMSYDMRSIYTPTCDLLKYNKIHSRVAYGIVGTQKDSSTY